MANENCLEGIKCPECGNEDNFKVYARSWFEINDDGTGDHEDVEWDDETPMSCEECQHQAPAKNFRQALMCAVRKVGGIWFARLGALRLSFCIAKGN